MADETELTRKRRGRYRENTCTYKFPTARRGKGSLQNVNQSLTVTPNGFNRCESDVQEVFCEQPFKLRCTATSLLINYFKPRQQIRRLTWMIQATFNWKTKMNRE